MTAATLDMNVLVSAAISPQGHPYQVLEAWFAARFEHVTSQHILSQMTSKLRSDRIGRHYGITTAAIRAFTRGLLERTPYEGIQIVTPRTFLELLNR
jgi:predicted nucleic acid-binding protein